MTATDHAATADDLRVQLKRTQAMERLAARHAMETDVTVAEAEARLAHSEADKANLTAHLRRRELEAHDLRALLAQTAAALNVALHHDPTRPHATEEMDGCREALRQATEALDAKGDSDDRHQ